MVDLEGFEPPTFRLKGDSSTGLSYRSIFMESASQSQGSKPLPPIDFSFSIWSPLFRLPYRSLGIRDHRGRLCFRFTEEEPVEFLRRLPNPPYPCCASRAPQTYTWCRIRVSDFQLPGFHRLRSFITTSALVCEPVIAAALMMAGLCSGSGMLAKWRVDVQIRRTQNGPRRTQI